MQQKKTGKESNLQQLEKLVMQENVRGKQPYYFMRFIGNQYPLQFVRFMKKHRSGTFRIDKDMLDEFLPIAISIVDDMCLEFQKFLIHPPQSEEEKKKFDMIVEKLEDMILEQSRDN